MARADVAARHRSRSSRSLGGPPAPTEWQGAPADRLPPRRRGSRVRMQDGHADRRAAELGGRRRACAAANAPTNGSRSATTTTPGCSAASTRASGTATMMETDPGAGRDGQARAAAAPHADLLQRGTARRSRSPARRSGASSSRRSCAPKLVAYLNVDSSASGAQPQGCRPWARWPR